MEPESLLSYCRAYVATIQDRVWIDNWIYWITLNYSYSVLQCTHFTVHCNTHTNLLSPGVLSPVVTSQRRSFLRSHVPRLRSSGLSD
jgi:hypothetical protein